MVATRSQRVTTRHAVAFNPLAAVYEQQRASALRRRVLLPSDESSSNDESDSGSSEFRDDSNDFDYDTDDGSDLVSDSDMASG